MSHAKKRYVARRAEIDRTLPFQLALPSYMCSRENFETVRQFCLDRFGADIPIRRVTTIREDNHQERYTLFCFATRDQAEVFASHFEGEPFDLKVDREKGKVEGAWRRKGPWVLIERCGPLAIPRFWVENP